MFHIIAIPGWRPTPLNQLLGHWARAYHAKRHDAEVIAVACLACGVPSAACRRRVDLEIVLPKGVRAYDHDAHWKSLLDGLVECGALRNDSPAWCHQGEVRIARGERLVTYVWLEDL